MVSVCYYFFLSDLFSNNITEINIFYFFGREEKKVTKIFEPLRELKFEK
jgi:hypothetical protein